MQILSFGSWVAFRDYLSHYFALPRLRRDQLWFCGHGTRSYGLQATLDRGRTWENAVVRENHYRHLLQEFRVEATRFGSESLQEFKPDIPLELIARHFGLPSPYLDWTLSPFVAASFALQTFAQHRSRYLAVFVLDRSRLNDTSGYVDIIDELDYIRFNRRAVKQRGVFLRVNVSDPPVESLLGAALSKCEVMLEDADRAHAEIDEMGLYPTSLLNDLPAAALAATMRVEQSVPPMS